MPELTEVMSAPMANMLLSVKCSVHRARTGLIHEPTDESFWPATPSTSAPRRRVRAPANCRSLVIVSVEITTTREDKAS
jgi:hypothetical protein